MMSLISDGCIEPGGAGVVEHGVQMSMQDILLIGISPILSGRFDEGREEILLFSVKVEQKRGADVRHAKA